MTSGERTFYFLLSGGITAPKNLYLHKFLKGSSFAIEYALAGVSWRPGRPVMWVFNVPEFLRFCYLNIPCLKVKLI